MTQLQERAKEVIKSCPEWYHSIELAPGVVTPGRAPLHYWEEQLRSLRLPDLHGKSVLDIGAYDGFYSFAAERLGASRVLSLDHYVWSADMTAYMRDFRESCRTGAPMPPPHESRHWRPEDLPGRRPFDAARALLGSRVEPVVGDFMTMDLTSLGQFDVVLFLGVLYHLRYPLLALERVFSVTKGMLILETHADKFWERRPVMVFYPGTELGGDASNWWGPNAACVDAMLKDVGFARVQRVTHLPSLPRRFATAIGAGIKRRVRFWSALQQNREFFHAWR